MRHVWVGERGVASTGKWVMERHLPHFFPNERCARLQEETAEVEAWLTELDSMSRFEVAASTWDKYTTEWKRAWKWCCRQITGKQHPTVRDLYVRPAVLYAYLTMVCTTSEGTGPLGRALNAITLAFRLHGLPSRRGDAQIQRLLKANKRINGVVKRKKAAISVQEVEEILRKWGTANNPLWKRCVAVAIGLMFRLMLRYNDLAQVMVGSVLFYGHGALVGIATRKNNQSSQPYWLPLTDTSSSVSVFKLLRQVLLARGFILPGRDGETIPLTEARYFWPLIRAERSVCKRGQTKRKTVRETRWPLIEGMQGQGVHNGYITFSRLFKRAVKECLGYPDAVVAEYASHSMRRGGDTYLANSGLSKEIRMVLGCWKTPEVESGYRALSAAQRLALTAKMAI